MRQKAFLGKIPTLTNFFKKGETFSMEITQHKQHKKAKEENQQQYGNNAQQSNEKEKVDTQTQQQEEGKSKQQKTTLQQPWPEDKRRDYLDKVNNILSVKYDDPALWERLSKEKNYRYNEKQI